LKTHGSQWLALVLALAGCTRPATQLLAVVETDAVCPAGSASLPLAIAVGAAPDGTRALLRASSDVDTGLPYRMPEVSWYDADGSAVVSARLGGVDGLHYMNAALVRPDGELWVLRAPWGEQSYADGFLELTRARLVREP